MKVLQTVRAAATLSIWAFITSTAPAEESHLETMRNHYSNQMERTQKPLSDLGTKYRTALIEVRDRLQKDANLDGLLEARNEIKRYDREMSPPGEFSQFESITRLQKIYPNYIEIPS